MMTRHSHRYWTSGHDEAGQVAIIMGLAMFLFLALFVIVGDNAFARMESRNLQNAVDAAALAGAQELDGTEAGAEDARSAAVEWANKNIDDATIETPVVSDGNTKITVTARKNSGSLFGGALSLGEPEIERRAAARIASVDILPCVVPLGVQRSFYENGVSSGGLVELKLAIQSGGSGTSNTGLLNLQPGNSAGPIANGSCNTLSDPATTKPGGTIGDVNNGLRDRLEAAISNACYTEAETLAELDRCKPGHFSSGTQATAVALLPVLDTDIVDSGAQSYPLATTASGQTLLAYFWIDGDSTYVNPQNNQWQCVDGASNCVIRGKFLENVPVDLSVFQGGNVTDFDPEALIKIVQLVE